MKCINATCKLVLESDTDVEYEYATYEGRTEYDAAETLDFTGRIRINKMEVEDPILSIDKSTDQTGKTKNIVRKIHKDIDAYSFIRKGYASVSNFKNGLTLEMDGVDLMAILLCRQIFEIYQDEGSLPEMVTVSKLMSV